MPQVMEAMRDLKMYLSLTVCLQLLKLLKIAGILVPKMGLAPAVLKKALPDLTTFALVFMISVLAFSSLFYIQVRTCAPQHRYSTEHPHARESATLAHPQEQGRALDR